MNPFMTDDRLPFLSPPGIAATINIGLFVFGSGVTSVIFSSSILRVHDVKEARQAISIFMEYDKQS
jgi:hypothetical protein